MGIDPLYQSYLNGRVWAMLKLSGTPDLGAGLENHMAFSMGVEDVLRRVGPAGIPTSAEVVSAIKRLVG
jgi:hypothetical protein